MSRKLRTLFVAAGFAVAAVGGSTAMTAPAAADGAGPAYQYKYPNGKFRYGKQYRRHHGRHHRGHGRKWRGRNCRPVYRTYWHYGHPHRKFVGYRCYPRYGYRR